MKRSGLWTRSHVGGSQVRKAKGKKPVSGGYTY